MKCMTQLQLDTLFGEGGGREGGGEGEGDRDE